MVLISVGRGCRVHAATLPHRGASNKLTTPPGVARRFSSRAALRRSYPLAQRPAGAPPMSGVDPERRRSLLEAVATWLDELETAEPMPPGVAPEVIQSAAPAPDLFSVLSQLTALTRETQLQGRATNRLHTELS